ncbi:MAG: chemotaxis protein CheX [Lachnospiraceae bacterium]|nr:chemotaxis protein CheX [Lachnospiraceae bacterium]MDE6698270.1 chemotaxis protein CheX [Lachnospiraceae bacterium]
MMQALDVKHINPFLQSSISVIEMTTQSKLAVGKPVIAKLEFPNDTFILQVGVTGVLKGQVLLVMNDENAKQMASRMMMGMAVNELDEMACSALGELSNMIMGNAATLFSAQEIFMDITPPITMHGTNLRLQMDVQALKIPMLEGGEEKISIYLCVKKE